MSEVTVDLEPAAAEALLNELIVFDYGAAAEALSRVASSDGASDWEAVRESREALDAVERHLEGLNWKEATKRAQPFPYTADRDWLHKTTLAALKDDLGEEVASGVSTYTAGGGTDRLRVTGARVQALAGLLDQLDAEEAR